MNSGKPEEDEARRLMAPRGMFHGRVDDKGRLKLPADFRKYFEHRGDTRLFVTSLDRRTARIYPIDAWVKVEDSLAHECETPEIANRIAFTAADLGAESELDAQGRILVPQELRRELGLEDSTVRLYFHGEHLRMLSESEYERQKAKAVEPREGEPGSLGDSGLR